MVVPKVGMADTVVAAAAAGVAVTGGRGEEVVG